MRFARLLPLVLMGLASPAAAQDRAPPAPPAPKLPAPASAPKLIVTISVDQFSADLFAGYRDKFTGGFRRLIDGGAVFPAGYQSHGATETCPGHSTILTGSRPARTGIIANTWIDLKAAREDKAIYCSEDEAVAGSNSRNYSASVTHLKVPTLGDRLKATSPGSRVVSVAGKDRAALMMGGHNTDVALFWGGKEFITLAGRTVPPIGQRANDAIARQLAEPRAALDLPPVCQSRARAVPIGAGKTVGDYRFARAAGDARAFRASPEMDGATLALAAALAQDMKLGRGPATDVLIAGVSATDYVGHTFGTQGAEMCLQLMALDRSLGDFLGRLDQLAVPYAVVLTADHGGIDLPERARDEAVPDAQRVSADLAANTVGKTIQAELKLPRQALWGDSAFGDMWVDPDFTPAQKAAVITAAKKRYLASPQVEGVYTAQQIAATPSPRTPPETWSILEKLRASYDPDRSGDILVVLKPRVTPITDPTGGYVATHGSVWDYDRRVPILFWRPGQVPFEQPMGVETVDILPTLAALIGLAVPAAEIDGRCLDLDPGAGTTCR